MKELAALKAKNIAIYQKPRWKWKSKENTEVCYIKKKKKKIKFEDYWNCLEATELEIKINQLEKESVDTTSLKENHKEFIKNNKLILKSQQRFKNE